MDLLLRSWAAGSAAVWPRPRLSVDVGRLRVRRELRGLLQRQALLLVLQEAVLQEARQACQEVPAVEVVAESQLGPAES